MNGASAQFFVLRAALLNRGIDPEKDVKIVSTPFGQMAGPLVLKEVDAIMGTADDIHSARQRVPVTQIGTITQMEGVDISL